MLTKTLIAAAALLAMSPFAALAQIEPSPAQSQYFPMPPTESSSIVSQDGQGGQVATSADRATRCRLFGRSIGVPPDRMEDYVRRCVQQ